VPKAIDDIASIGPSKACETDGSSRKGDNIVIIAKNALKDHFAQGFRKNKPIDAIVYPIHRIVDTKDSILV
jgi:hypothetical protein